MTGKRRQTKGQRRSIAQKRCYDPDPQDAGPPYTYGYTPGQTAGFPGTGRSLLTRGISAQKAPEGSVSGAGRMSSAVPPGQALQTGGYKKGLYQKAGPVFMKKPETRVYR